jgi:PhoPQ-activated pathogenicity-related protein
MKRPVFVLLALACALVAQPASPFKHQTALDRYVAAPDPNYKWELSNTIEGKGYKAYVIELTSQGWRNEKEVDRTVWKHWLTIIRPETVKYSTGFLFITGGSNKAGAPKTPDIMLTQTALDTGAVVAELKQVPNQPLTFPDDGKPRNEDGIIAYTWDKFLKGGDENWPLRLPMTKSAVKAMDTITAFGKAPNGGDYNVGKFVVSGGSKRGWTAWTTAAVDKRVEAVLPIVIDILNIEANFQHHYRAYGFFAPSVKDYVERGLMDWDGTKEYRALMQIEEPYQYRDRLTMPKYIVNAAGDQFFVPDSSQFYWNDLKGEKLLRYVPNADHGMGGSDVNKSLTSYFDLILRGAKRPEYSWKVLPNGDIHVAAKEEPSEVKVWMAVNPEARDFRVEKVGRIYKETPLAPVKKGEWIAKAPVIEKGYAAYFVELTFPTGGKYPLKVTTQVKVMPDTYAAGPYKPEKPMGTPVKK